jgi:hypothetical protein
MPWLEIADFGAEGWSPQVESSSRARIYCDQLEQGKILLFSRPPFDLPTQDREFLLNQPASDSRLHKNISYRPQEDVLRGVSDGKDAQQRIHQILSNYSKRVTAFVSRFLAPYAGQMSLDFASFRPLEEQGRDLPLHKRNDLLHVDAFPSRPTRGGRILRVFTNIHPEKQRVWLTGEAFASLAQRHASNAGLDKIVAANSGLLAGLKRKLPLPGITVAGRSAYDEFMLRFHDYLKENSAFQHQKHETVTFPPLATWLVFTDGVPHAALSGQSALEQTFIVPVFALVSPEQAPIRVLESLCGRSLAT